MNDNNVTYRVSFRVESIQKEVKRFIDNENIKGMLRRTLNIF